MEPGTIKLLVLLVPHASFCCCLETKQLSGTSAISLSLVASFATCITIQEVLEEMAKFRAALRKYYNSKNQSCVIFERNFRSQHLQLQVCYIIHKIF